MGFERLVEVARIAIRFQTTDSLPNAQKHRPRTIRYHKHGIIYAQAEAMEKRDMDINLSFRSAERRDIPPILVAGDTLLGLAMP